MEVIGTVRNPLLKNIISVSSPTETGEEGSEGDVGVRVGGFVVED